MKVTIKQYTGTTVEISVNSEDLVVTMLEKMYRKRKNLHLTPTLWLQRIEFFLQGCPLVYLYHSTVEQLKLQDGSIIVEMLKP